MGGLYNERGRKRKPFRDGKPKGYEEIILAKYFHL
jgi:hypothetical protein